MREKNVEMKSMRDSAAKERKDNHKAHEATRRELQKLRDSHEKSRCKMQESHQNTRADLNRERKLRQSLSAELRKAHACHDTTRQMMRGMQQAHEYTRAELAALQNISTKKLQHDATARMDAGSRQYMTQATYLGELARVMIKQVRSAPHGL